MLTKRSAFAVFLVISAAALHAQIYTDTAYSIEARVEDLLGLMTLEEKVGQMTQVRWGSLDSPSDMETYYIGSLLNGGGGAPHDNTPSGWADMYDSYQSQALHTRLGIPYIYGTDAVHGHNNLYGAVIFPHHIGMGCTRDEALVEEAARITAIEVSATGVDWTFGPCVTVPRDERWGRTYEGFSEDPELVARLGAAEIRGFQGTDPAGPLTIMACAKHYLGDGGTTGGHDQGDTFLEEEDLRRIHLPPYISAVSEGVGSVMASFSSWNGEKMHGQKYLLTSVLKEELGFEGFIISDWAGIDQLPGDYVSDIETSINAGIDMVMVPSNYRGFISGLISLVHDGKVSMDRIDDANRRILTQKFRFGLFEAPYADRSLVGEVGIPEHREVARRCVRESLVVLKNKNKILPLPKGAGHIHVAGKSADNLGYQCGGWTIQWQGASGDITPGTTTLEAVRTVAGGEVTYSETGYSEDAAGAHAAIVVIGERPYAEGNGDRTYLGLEKGDIDAVKSLYYNGIRVVTIIISGRPLLLEEIWHYSDAVIAAWLPGTEGTGITDILFGDYEPSGKLSFTWPADMEQIPINTGDVDYEPFLPYGFGIDTFALPSVTDPPVLFSAATDRSGFLIELTFNKPMELPSEPVINLTVNGNYAAVENVRLKPEDPNTLLITPGPELQPPDIIRVTSAGGIPAADGSVSGPFDQKVYNDIASFQAIPGRIEAEDYLSMSGIRTETCTDTGGGLNVGYIERGDYLEYVVDIEAQGSYAINYRVASETTGGALMLQVLEENEWTGMDSISFGPTGGWQQWVTVTDTTTLPAGRHMIRLLALMDGFNVNWIEFTSAGGVSNGHEVTGPHVLVFPNPVDRLLHIRSPGDQPVRYTMYNATGQECATGNCDNAACVDVTCFSAGIYILRLEVGAGSRFMKITVR